MNIHIISWNLCWGCMSGNIFNMEYNGKWLNKTAENIGRYCACKGKHYCLNNVSIFLINKFINKKTFIICLQEAFNWKILYNLLKKKLNISYLHCKYNKAEVVIFYSSNYFKPIALKSDDIIINKSSGGRPFLNIIFKLYNLSNNNIYYFNIINLHNMHYISKNDLENILNYNNNKFFINNKYNKKNFENIQNYKLVNLNNKIKINDYNLLNGIICGDFNDFYGSNFWKGLNIKLNNYIIEYKSKKIPPKTCCYNDLFYQNNKNIHNKIKNRNYGDYILLSNNNMSKYIINNIIPNKFIKNKNFKDYPTSDHKPIYSKILLKF